MNDEQFTDYKALMSRDSATGRLSVISSKTAQ